MTKERSGNPSGNPDNPQKKAADGWPSWMGDADPSLAPAPVRPKAAPKPVAPSRQAAAAPRSAPPPKAVPPPALPPAAAEPSVPRRWLRSLIGIVAILIALVAGDMAARSRPEAALKFQQVVIAGLDRLPTSLPLLPIAAAAAFVLLAVLVWQAGRTRRPLFLPVALLLCATSAGFGVFRGGRDVDLERSAGTLQKDFRDWRNTASKELQSLHRKLQEETARAQAAQAERDKMAASLETSSVAHQATCPLSCAMPSAVTSVAK